MLIAQISDSHVRAQGRLLYGTIDTSGHLARAVASLNELDPQPDLVWFTGDLVDAGSAEEYAYLKSLLASLKAPCRVIPGNHDAREPLRAAFADHPWAREAGAFLNYVIDEFPVRLVALDSLDPGKVEGRLCAERLRWLDRTLTVAPERPTIIAVHHPPFLNGIAHMDGLPMAGRDEFAAVVSRHPQVERVISGHVHRVMMRRWAGTMATTCPSTAHQFALDLRPGRPSCYVLEPPGYQLHTWLPGQGLVTHTGVIGEFTSQNSA